MNNEKIILSAALGSRAANAPALTDPAFLKRLATLCDTAGLDFILFGQPADIEPPSAPDAFIMASWLIAATGRIGLVPAIGATYAQPFHAARALSAMDILSGGRMGWMPTGAGYDRQAPHYGNLPHLPLAVAYEKAGEFVAATEALWDSWDADALVVDKDSAIYLDSAKVRRVDYRGAHFSVMGPLNAARPIQGYPVLVQDESDPLFGVRGGKADVVLIAAETPADAKRRVQQLKTGNAVRVLVKIDCAFNDGAAAMSDRLEERRRSSGCDGFYILPETAPGDFERFLEQIAPRLKSEESAIPSTLRARLRIAPPINPYSL